MLVESRYEFESTRHERIRAFSPGAAFSLTISWRQSGPFPYQEVQWSSRLRPIWIISKQLARQPAWMRVVVGRTVAAALAEDIGDGDITSETAVPERVRVEARAVAREPGVLAGIAVFEAAFRQVSHEVQTKLSFSDGRSFDAGDTLAVVNGTARSILAAERVALNFLQRMCGIATETARYVEAVQGTRATILDTRKTVPGLRIFDKYSVRAGGGANHRMGLFDAALVKDNHIAAAGSLRKAVSRVRRPNAERARFIEVECDTLDQVVECLELGVSLILLDNMGVDEMARAVKLAAGRAKLEASGNVGLQNVREIAETGVDYISVGSLTHSVSALDIGLDISQLGRLANE